MGVPPGTIKSLLVPPDGRKAPRFGQERHGQECKDTICVLDVSTFMMPRLPVQSDTSAPAIIRRCTGVAEWQKHGMRAPTHLILVCPAPSCLDVRRLHSTPPPLPSFGIPCDLGGRAVCHKPDMPPLGSRRIWPFLASRRMRATLLQIHVWQGCAVAGSVPGL